MTCLFLFSGCAATVDSVGSSTPLVRPSEQAEKSVVMTLTRLDDEQPNEDWQAFRNEWRDAVSNIATENGTRFRLVENGENIEDNAVLIKGTVNGFRYVSPGKRIAFGAMTGNAYMDIGFEFIEVPMGRPLGYRQYSTSSQTMEGIFSAMTDRQVRATAEAMWKDLFN